MEPGAAVRVGGDPGRIRPSRRARFHLVISCPRPLSTPATIAHALPVDEPSTDARVRHLQFEVLESLAAAEHYNAWIASLTLPFLGDHPVEIGSGIGVSATLWLDTGLERITVSDVDPACLAALEDRFGDDPRVKIARVDLEDAPAGTHSAAVALNVLEHIEDDVAAIRGAKGLVRPEGLIVVFVPAFDFAAGRFDREIGHYRRYTTDSIAQTFAEAGTTLVTARYVNAPGLVAWFAGIRLLGLTPGDGPLLRAWDRFVIPAVRRVETRWSPPFGQSVLAVARVEPS